MKQTFTIIGRLEGLNDYVNACRTHANAGGRMKRHQQMVVAYAVKLARLKPFRSPVHIHFHWVEPDRRRDKDNVCGAGRKFILDALVQMRVLKDDGWAHVYSFSDTFDVDKKNPRIEVTIEEVDTRCP